MSTLSDYRQQLDALTDELLKRSGETMRNIDASIKLTHSFKLSNSLVSQMDLQTQILNRALKKYQTYLTDLNSLMIRSEYLEAQLNSLEAHQKLNRKRALQGLEALNDWKDDYLSLRTIEATLGNLYLELRHLTKKVETKETYSPKKPTLIHRFTYSDDESEISPKQPLRVPKNQSSYFELKPIRCSSRSEETTSTPKSQNSFNLLTKKKTQLPTPDSSFSTSFSNSPVIHKQSIVSEKATDDLSIEEHYTDDSPLAHRAKKHTRSSSLPKSIDFSLGMDSEILRTLTVDKKFNLRHFLSYDTGLKSKQHEEKESNGTENKDITIEFQSPKSTNTTKMTISSSPDTTKETTMDDECSIMEDEEEEEEEEDSNVNFLPTFEHKLNRSNSCDSIFSTMVSRVPLRPAKDNREQTLSWMSRFNHNQRSNVLQSNVNTFSVTSITTSSSDTRKALSHLVSQPSTQQTTLDDSSKISVSATKPYTSSSPSSSTSKPTSTVFSSFQSFLKQAPTPSRIPEETGKNAPTPIVSIDQSNTPRTSSYQSFSSELIGPKNESKQWTNLFTKLYPQNFLPSQSVVTSEVGKPIPITKRSNSKTNTHQKEVVKGSFSTLTIGPNGSKYVQHGESSSMAQSQVLSSRVSHSALREALNNELFS